MQRVNGTVLKNEQFVNEGIVTLYSCKDVIFLDLVDDLPSEGHQEDRAKFHRAESFYVSECDQRLSPGKPVTGLLFPDHLLLKMIEEPNLIQ